MTRPAVTAGSTPRAARAPRRVVRAPMGEGVRGEPREPRELMYSSRGSPRTSPARCYPPSHRPAVHARPDRWLPRRAAARAWPTTLTRHPQVLAPENPRGCKAETGEWTPADGRDPRGRLSALRRRVPTPAEPLFAPATPRPASAPSRSFTHRCRCGGLLSSGRPSWRR
jgi:hypothetical protein